jgi:two-component system, cell cycle response regulator DivK
MDPRDMANETILVVDDAPVSLKLTDILLRKEGYKVHATTDAEQALSLLLSVHPDMMLVDIQLPGMNGLELTKRVKQDSRTRDIVVVALTACAMKGDDDLAFQAGCDGYITKPIETLTLATKVREYLSQRSAPQFVVGEAVPGEVHGFPGGITLSPTELESVRRRFLQDGAQQCRILLGNLERDFDLNSTLKIARGWVEASQALDYPVLAILAGEAEKMLCAKLPDKLQLCDALSNLMVGFAEPPEASVGPIPNAVEAALKGKTVALIGVPDEDAERLAGALERAGAKARRFDPSSRPASETLAACSLVVVHAGPRTMGTNWLHPLALRELKQPMVLIGVRLHLLDLDSAVLSRAAELLIDGWQPEEALIRFGHAVSRTNGVKSQAAGPGDLVPSMFGTPLSREVSRESEVLLADDDLTVRMVVRSLMQNAGIKCRMACDGNEALQAIRDCQPTAAVLDVNMPGMDGYEVLAAVRHDGIPVKIILLTARQQEADITRGFTLGADDYVVKPFNPPELLARVKRYL